VFIVMCMHRLLRGRRKGVKQRAAWIVRDVHGSCICSRKTCLPFEYCALQLQSLKLHLHLVAFPLAGAIPFLSYHIPSYPATHESKLTTPRSLWPRLQLHSITQGLQLRLSTLHHPDTALSSILSTIMVFIRPSRLLPRRRHCCRFHLLLPAARQSSCTSSTRWPHPERAHLH